MEKNKKTVYIAGPMRGYVNYNFEAFDAAKRWLVDQGFDVVSPADIDRESGFVENAFKTSHNWEEWAGALGQKETILRDVREILECDCICLLQGWETSTGARAEKAVAEWSQKEIMYYTNNNYITL